MINNPDGNLHVYMLSVGQADTSVIISPEGRVVVIDATRPTKLLQLLDDLVPSVWKIDRVDGNAEQSEDRRELLRRRPLRTELAHQVRHMTDRSVRHLHEQAEIGDRLDQRRR